MTVRIAVRPLSILDRHYQPGDEVDTRDIPQRRVEQLKKHGMLKEYDAPEMVAVLAERLEAVEARLAMLEAQGTAGGDAGSAVVPATPGRPRLKQRATKDEED